MSETKPIKRSRPETENTAQGDAAVPFRDCDRLYACQVTLHCAYRKRCVPCAYKVGCFDVALDQEFCRVIPNQRPEQCPRSKEVRGAEGTLGYTPGMAILTIGDGDFTYSLAIARILHKQATSVIATSYESKESLVKVYPGIKKTIAELEALGVTIGFKVDATRIKETLPSIKDKQFDRIVWNFPCSAIAKGQDGQNEEMEYNKGLVRDFVSNARPLLKEQGQIHLNHKTKPPFNQWNIEEVAVDSCRASNGPAVVYLGRVVLDRFLFPPYVPRKALHHKSFPAHDACTFMFGLDCGGEPEPLATSSTAEFFDEDDSSQPAASCLVKVTPELIGALRSLLISSTPYSRLPASKISKRRPAKVSKRSKR